MINYIAILTALLLFALLPQKAAFAQQDTTMLPMDTLFVDSIDYSINEYDKYTPLIGGKEFRLQNGLKINALIKDYYPDSTLKHRGYYTNGQLLSMYKNYYPNGKMERSFATSGTSKLVIESFWPNGNAKEYIEYRKGEILFYRSYFLNGNKETLEEHDRKTGYYLVFNNYYKNGKLKSSMELVDKKKWSYNQKEFYPSGKIKEEGPVLYNVFQYDYQRHGSWKVYNEQGRLVETQEYYEGELIQ